MPVSLAVSEFFFSISLLLRVTFLRAEKKPSPGGGPEEAFVQTKPPSNISGGFLPSTIGTLLMQTVPIRVFL